MKLLTVFVCSLVFIGNVWAQDEAEYNKWLFDKFSQQHQALIPVVAVANIFTGCNQQRKVDPIQYQVKDLVLKMSRTQLSDKVLACLGEDTLQSSTAIDFGLVGCFYSQFSYLSIPDKKAKMQQVQAALAQLSLTERKKSFTECTTMQAIDYLK